jgi:manganese/zinc/iron transport system permease protein
VGGPGDPEQKHYPMSILLDLLNDYTLRTIALGAAVLGIVSGALGCFAVLRRQALLGDAMSHAALPGIVLAFLLTGLREPLVLMIGAALAGWVAALLMMAVVRTTRIKEDTALGILLAVFFGFGLVLLAVAQKQPDAAQAGLKKFLFGQAASLVERDVITMAGVGIVALVVMLLFWKEFKLLSFNAEYGASLGFPIRALDILLTSLIVVAIVIGLQTVGVVLMSAMLVAPAAAARQWTDRLGVMVALAGLFGALAGVAGALISALARGLSTGPTIVLCVAGIVIFSLLLAPNRGLLWARLRHARNRRRLRTDAVLADLLTLEAQHPEASRGHSIATLRAMNAGRGGVQNSLDQLEAQGLARRIGADGWALTEAGTATARARADEAEEQQQ